MKTTGLKNYSDIHFMDDANQRRQPPAKLGSSQHQRICCAAAGVITEYANAWTPG
jgi:hypothetical protein